MLQGCLASVAYGVVARVGRTRWTAEPWGLAGACRCSLRFLTAPYIDQRPLAPSVSTNHPREQVGRSAAARSVSFVNPPTSNSRSTTAIW